MVIFLATSQAQRLHSVLLPLMMMTTRQLRGGIRVGLGAQLELMLCLHACEQSNGDRIARQRVIAIVAGGAGAATTATAATTADSSGRAADCQANEALVPVRRPHAVCLLNQIAIDDNGQRGAAGNFHAQAACGAAAHEQAAVEARRVQRAARVPVHVTSQNRHAVIVRHAARAKSRITAKSWRLAHRAAERHMPLERRG